MTVTIRIDHWHEPHPDGEGTVSVEQLARVELEPAMFDRLDAYADAHGLTLEQALEAALASVPADRKVVAQPEPRICRAYDALCVNPAVCTSADACCAGDVARTTRTLGPDDLLPAPPTADDLADQRDELADALRGLIRAWPELGRAHSTHEQQQALRRACAALAAAGGA